MTQDHGAEPRSVLLALKALARGAGVLAISVVAIWIIFFFILAAVLAGFFG